MHSREMYKIVSIKQLFYNCLTIILQTGLAFITIDFILAADKFKKRNFQISKLADRNIHNITARKISYFMNA